MAFFVDVQGFKLVSNNQFIVKELSFIDLNGDHFGHYHFKPPFPFPNLCDADKRQVVWLSKNFHGLDWNKGDTDYNVASKQLTSIAHKHSIYCKGLEKTQWILDLIDASSTSSMHIVNVEDFGYPNFQLLHREFHCEKKHCILHHTHCTSSNVICMLSYYNKNRI